MLNKTLNNYWMPFTAINKFNKNPILLNKSSGIYYTTDDDRQILDSVSGLWCCNCGHSRVEIADAISNQAKKMAYAPSFQISHQLAFEYSNKLSKITPKDLNSIFFTNSGSEAVDTALKMVLAYYREIGQGSKVKFIGREKGYHGVGFGGISVGGLGNNRKQFGNLLSGIDHLPHTMKYGYKPFNRNQPEENNQLADELLNIIELHDASTIAAVIIEPISGSAGVIIPPKNYLKRIRKICDQHNIKLIFDEVITGFGRIGEAFASQRFNVIPDLITCAKGLTNGAVPMGAVIAKQEMYDAFLNKDKKGIEFFHGYTYSASPLACAAGLAALEIYQSENLFNRSRELEKYFEDKLHQIKGKKYVKDIRNFGLIGAIELETDDNYVGSRGYKAFNNAFFKEDLLIRITGDTLAFAPPLIINKDEIDLIFSKVNNVIDNLNN